MKDGMPSSASGNFGYRPFIKNISIEQVPSDRRRSGEGTNKTFFSNIKAELNNIRTDVNKLVSKDINKISNNKSYTMGSSAQKFQPPSTDTGFQKNAQRRLLLQESREKVNASNNLAYQAKIAQLTSKLNFQSNKNEDLMNQIQEQRKYNSNLRDQMANFRQKQMKFQYQINIRNKEIENQKFLYQRLIREKQQSAKVIQKLQSQVRRGSFKATEKIIEKVVEPDLQSLQKIKMLQNTVYNLEGQLKYLRQDCNNLKYDLDNFEKNKQVEIVAITKNFQEKLGRAEAKTYKQLGAGFQIKINELLDENYRLKNKIGMLQSQIQQGKVQLESLKSTIQAYEARDRQIGKGAMQQQLQNLQEKVMQLQQQKDKMQSDHEFQIMKLENIIDQLKSNSNNKNENKSFNQILKDQINQIQNLKEKLRKSNQAINKMKK